MNLIPKLLKQKFRVSVFIQENGKPFGNAVEYIRGDLLKPVSFERKIKSVDVIIHCAGMVNINYSVAHPREVLQTNVAMLFNLLEVLRKKHQKPLVIFTSTDRVYGKTKKKVADETVPTFPIEAYTASKIAGEMLLHMYQNLYGIPYVILRVDTMYGPHQPEKMFVGSMIRSVLTEHIARVGKLDVYKNFVYVGDVADAIIASVKSPRHAWNSIINIGGAYISLRDFVSTLCRLISKQIGADIRIVFDPKLVRSSVIELTPFKLSVAKARRVLGWQPRTSLIQSLSETVRWFLHEY